MTIAWTIAATDNCAGAGIQIDMATMNAMGVHACSVITAVTAQNTQQFYAIQNTDDALIAAQINALKTDLPAKAIKLGALGTSETTVARIIEFLQSYLGPVVCDPVMMASSDRAKPLSDSNLLRQLLPHITLLTPNIPEAEILCQCRINTVQDMEQAAQILLSYGVKNVLLKGGHANLGLASDYFTDGKQSFWINSRRLENINVRGTGCVLSSAITAALALDYDMLDAIVIGKMVLNQGLRQARALGCGAKIIKELHWPREQQDLPWISKAAPVERQAAFSTCGDSPLGFYPIVDSALWIERLLKCGVKTLQLRIKNKMGDELEQEIVVAIQFARQYGARLFINDYWELAIKHGAYGVHLGQQDLQTADFDFIRAAGCRLGLSTHCFYEVACAHSWQPSYMAFGPIYATTSKQMCFGPRGLEALHFWRKLLDYPMVAIGGINLMRVDAVLATEVDGVAVISAVTQADDPENTTQRFLTKFLEGQLN